LQLNRAFFLGLLSLVKIAGGLILYRLVTTKIGVEGLPILGHALTIMGLMTFFASGGISRSYLYYYSVGNESERGNIQYATGIILFFASVLLFLILIPFSDHISTYLMGDRSLSTFIKIVGLMAYFVGFNNVAFSHAATIGEQVKSSLINIAGIIIGITAILVLTNYYSDIYFYYPIFHGSLIFIGMWLAYGHIGIDLRRDLHIKHIKKSLSIIKKLFLYSASVISYLVSTYTILLYFRRSLILNVGMDQTGLWEIAQKLSDGYMQFLGLIMVYLILPSFISVFKEKSKLLRQLTKYSGLLYSFLIIVYSTVFFFGEFLIGIVFGIEGEALIRANELTKLFIITDFVRITYMLFQHVNMAGNHIKTFILIEMLNIVLTVSFLHFFHAASVDSYMYSYIAANVILVIICIVLVWKNNRTIDPTNSLAHG
jgi:O-antigen/teichoic acid export membrane protein